MHLKRLNNLLLAFILSTPLFAQDSNKDILSQDRLNLFEFDQKKADEDSAKLRKDWINPIQYQYTKNLGEGYENEKSVITINQPVFQSGGIYEAITYADSNYKYATLEIKQRRKTLITEALNYLFSIKRSEINIQRAKLSVLNAQIDVNRKKEQVLNGFLDSSFLDNAILDLNSAKHTLIDIKYQKKELIRNFHNISSQNYKKFDLPHFSIYSKKEYMEKNLEIKKAQADIVQKENLSYMTLTRYLPSLNVFYTHTQNHYTDGNPGLEKGSSNTYGISINLPLDSRALNDVEARRIDYLKSKLTLKNKMKDEETFFKTKLDKISMLDERISITNQDLATYKSILKIIEEEKEAELKTQSDVETLQNSQKIKLLDLRLYNLDKQIELLQLYARLH